MCKRIFIHEALISPTPSAMFLVQQTSSSLNVSTGGRGWWGRREGEWEVRKKREKAEKGEK